MPKHSPQDWEILERELHDAGVSPAEVEAGARQLLAEAADTGSPRHASMPGTQKDLAAAMGVSVAVRANACPHPVHITDARSLHVSSNG